MMCLDSHQHFWKYASATFKAAVARGIDFFGKGDAAPDTRFNYQFKEP